MPSFSEDTIAYWRSIRVHEHRVPHDPASLGWLRIIDADIRDEEATLEAARRQVVESEEVLRLLRAKRAAVVDAP